eukprot:TRINITY_DN29710_c0_g1_i1.p1 TRINITY_DN29710_c0_g1~~TRINITY_DN29710_c0_g1_i1.p1  ORF type:complete len:213 (+),score=15.99 TRINITY_DN29710_c0_g1_i1:110-748(+)
MPFPQLAQASARPLTLKYGAWDVGAAAGEDDLDSRVPFSELMEKISQSRQPRELPTPRGGRPSPGALSATSTTSSGDASSNSIYSARSGTPRLPKRPSAFLPSSMVPRPFLAKIAFLDPKPVHTLWDEERIAVPQRSWPSNDGQVRGIAASRDRHPLRESRPDWKPGAFNRRTRGRFPTPPPCGHRQPHCIDDCSISARSARSHTLEPFKDA